MELPAPRDFGWPLKPMSSAETGVTKLSNGQIELRIDHATIRGVTAAMLAWWFHHFTKLEVEKGGVVYPAYLIWHPADHFAATAGNTTGDQLEAGDQIHIQEVFQRNPAYELDAKAEVSQLDNTGMGLRVTVFGHTLMDLVHSYRDVDGGAEYRSRMLVGCPSGWAKPLINKLIVPRKFGDAKAQAWLQHNVEEVGYFEHFLPRLYERRDQGKLIRLDA